MSHTLLLTNLYSSTLPVSSYIIDSETPHSRTNKCLTTIYTELLQWYFAPNRNHCFIFLQFKYFHAKVNYNHTLTVDVLYGTEASALFSLWDSKPSNFLSKAWSYSMAWTELWFTGLINLFNVGSWHNFIMWPTEQITENMEYVNYFC